MVEKPSYHHVIVHAAAVRGKGVVAFYGSWLIALLDVDAVVESDFHQAL